MSFPGVIGFADGACQGIMPPSNCDQTGVSDSPMEQTGDRTKSLILRNREDRRLRAGHLWIYSNEVDTSATRLTEFEPGEPVTVLARSGRPLGSGYVNPHSLICARLLSEEPGLVPDEAFFRSRIQQADALRAPYFSDACYRMVYGEGDLLPGLVIDRYGDVLVIQVTTAGMERHIDLITSVVVELYQPRAVVWRNDTRVREMEGLELTTRVAHGDPGQLVELRENGLRYQVDVLSGQKTGWFFDHRANRQRMLAHVPRGGRVLDVCSYLGAWGLQSLAAGAGQVECVDSSETAVAGIHRNAELNGMADRVTTHLGDAFETLRELRDSGERFDAVILDPPSFIKRRKDFKAGFQAYRRLNQLAMQLCKPQGFLISASCSFHMPREQLLNAVLQAGRAVGRLPQLLDTGGLGRDHPTHPAIAETDYLKAYLLRVIPL